MLDCLFRGDAGKTNRDRLDSKRSKTQSGFRLKKRLSKALQPRLADHSGAPRLRL